MPFANQLGARCYPKRAFEHNRVDCSTSNSLLGCLCQPSGHTLPETTRRCMTVVDVVCSSRQRGLTNICESWHLIACMACSRSPAGYKLPERDLQHAKEQLVPVANQLGARCWPKRAFEHNRVDCSAPNSLLGCLCQPSGHQLPETTRRCMTVLDVVCSSRQRGLQYLMI